MLKKLYFEDKVFNGVKANVSFAIFFLKLYNTFYPHPSQVKYHDLSRLLQGVRIVHLLVI